MSDVTGTLEAVSRLEGTLRALWIETAGTKVVPLRLAEKAFEDMQLLTAKLNVLLSTRKPVRSEAEVFEGFSDEDATMGATGSLR